MSQGLENMDLIDFQVGCTELPKTSTSDFENSHEHDFDNLIDTELPVLERKLQSAPNSIQTTDSRKSSIDIEDILISIDDNYNNDETDNDVFLDLCSNATPNLNNDNSEALLVLQNLDDVLNASLLEEPNTNTEENIKDEQAQKIIEDCLLDLDNYLRALDSSCEDSFSESTRSDLPSNDSTTPRASSSELSDTQSYTEAFESSSTRIDEDNNPEEEEERLRERLRQIEVNYSKFLASGCVNRGYVDSENNDVADSFRRPMSACGVINEAVNRNHPARATIAVVRRERPKLQRMEGRKSLGRENIARYSGTRISVPSAAITAPTTVSDDETVDWTWVHDMANEVTLERRAHASGDYCTGTVTVEPLHKPTTTTSSTSEPTMAPKDDVQNSNSWLRSSMRRLQRHRIPNVIEIPSENGTVPPAGGTVLPQSSATVLPRLEFEEQRPVSAPSRLPQVLRTSVPTRASRSRSRVSQNGTVGGARSSSESSRSRRRRSLSSSVTSVASSVDSLPSTTPAVTPVGGENLEAGQTNGSGIRRSCDRNTAATEMPAADSPLGQWPHSLSSMMACLGCTLGLFNISRFSILTVHFGANFIFQFLLLSMVFGLPLFTLQLCLGQQLGAGVIDMWKISPLFQGVGVALLIAQGLIGLYSIIGVSWMFVFFRDSFVTKVDRYRWAEPFFYYRPVIQAPVNGSYKLTETIPDYFNGIVLQRHHLPSGTAYGTIKFQLAFNLAVVWLIIFVSLSKGLRSYGKVIYAFTLFPVFGTFILCAKILGLMPPEFVNIIFPETSWDEFFLNPKSWLAAAQETFLTWGLLGAAIMQIASHNKHKHLLQRDSSLVAVITLTILILMAFLANTCVQILKSYGYNYVPNSFERMSSYQFLRSSRDSLPPSLSSLPVRGMVHNSFIIGEKVARPGVDFTSESGYQVLRLATELVPATFAVLGSDQVSSFWAVLFYFILIMFGICQQLAIWHCVITGIMAIKANVLKSWETTITFFSCACGFVLGLPMATELGIYVVYFMDYTVGGIWWLSIVILLQIVAVFMVRGRPYSGDTIVTALFRPNTHTCVMSFAPALLSFTWNVILPVFLMVLCISTFKNGNFRDMFIWHHAPVAEYWPLWARQIGSMLQLLPILCIPFVAVIQSYRYLNNGPSDILDRIQLLYRPPIGEHMEDPPILDSVPTAPTSNTTPNLPTEDPPPKYTPPPSYTTATGARLAKFLRQSIRRSVRRLANVLGETSGARPRPTLLASRPPPPDYSAVIVELNTRAPGGGQDVLDSVVAPRVSTLERLRNLEASPTALTAAEVASILRSSFRRSTVRSPNNNIRTVNFNDLSVASLSAENLVDSVAPIGETSLVLEGVSSSSERGYKSHVNNNVSSVI